MERALLLLSCLALRHAGGSLWNLTESDMSDVPWNFTASNMTDSPRNNTKSNIPDIAWNHNKSDMPPNPWNLTKSDMPDVPRNLNKSDMSANPWNLTKSDMPDVPSTLINIYIPTNAWNLAKSDMPDVRRNLIKNAVPDPPGNHTISTIADVRIVGGKKTTIHKYPFMVAIHLNDMYHCGGTLLTPDTVLTASHCVYDRELYVASGRHAVISPHMFRVVLGSTSSAVGGGTMPTVRTVSRTLAHPHFRFTSMKNDIALLKLSRPVPLSHTIQLVDILADEPPPGTMCTALGWGITHKIGADDQIFGNFEDELHVVDLPIISIEECKLRMISVIDQNLCTYTPSKDACVGDSGGPLMCFGKQAGIISYGRGCAAAPYPGIYQKVYIHGSWEPLVRTGRVDEAAESGRFGGRGRAARGRRSMLLAALPSVLMALAALPRPLPA